MENNSSGGRTRYPLMGSESKESEGGIIPFEVEESGYPPSQGTNRHPTPGTPITTQPTSQGDSPTSNWMSFPQTVSNCPPGLEYLFMVDELIINREPNLKATIVGWVSKTGYIITNSRGENVYYAGEISECCSRNCCGSSRSFELKIFDNFGNEVISMIRALACQHCCCPCCLQSIEISSPPGTIAGVVEQKWSIFYPNFVIKNSAGDVRLRIRGPFLGSACCADVNFMILSADGSMEVGKVYKKFLGCGNQTYTDENVFGVEFPMDLDVRMKASVLGACFLIEMMYFELAGNMRTAPRLPLG